MRWATVAATCAAAPHTSAMRLQALRGEHTACGEVQARAAMAVSVGPVGRDGHFAASSGTLAPAHADP